MQSDKEIVQVGRRKKEETGLKGVRKNLFNFISGEIKYFLICDLYREIERIFSISEANGLLLGKNKPVSSLLEQLFELINKYTADKSLLNIFKQLFIIQIFTHKSAEKGEENLQLKNICQEKLNSLLGKECKLDLSTKRKYNILSFIFQSPQSKHFLYSIQKSSKLQSFVDEIHSKILKPFSFYQMKKFENHQLYSKLFSQQNLVEQQIWKTLNLSNQLIHMIKNANKLLHYYTSQFQWLFLSFISIVCLDLNIFFRKLSTQIGKKSSEWSRQIHNFYQLRSKDYAQYIEKQDELLLNRQLNQVRNMVQELYEIQGGLLYLDQNQKLRSLFYAFSIPFTWLNFNDSKNTTQLEEIAEFSIKMTTKLQEGAKKRKNSSDTGITEESFKLFDSLEIPQDLIFEEIN